MSTTITKGCGVLYTNGDTPMPPVYATVLKITPGNPAYGIYDLFRVRSQGGIETNAVKEELQFLHGPTDADLLRWHCEQIKKLTPSIDAAVSRFIQFQAAIHAALPSMEEVERRLRSVKPYQGPGIEHLIPTGAVEQAFPTPPRFWYSKHDAGKFELLRVDMEDPNYGYFAPAEDSVMLRGRERIPIKIQDGERRLFSSMLPTKG